MCLGRHAHDGQQTMHFKNQRALYSAICERDHDRIKQCVKRGGDLNVIFSRSLPPLWLALSTDIMFAEFLVQCGASLFKQFCISRLRPMSALGYSLYVADRLAVRFCLAHGEDINRLQDGCAPIVHALMLNNLEILDELIAHGVDVHAAHTVDNVRMTPIHYAFRTLVSRERPLDKLHAAGARLTFDEIKQCSDILVCAHVHWLCRNMMQFVSQHETVSWLVKTVHFDCVGVLQAYGVPFHHWHVFDAIMHNPCVCTSSHLFEHFPEFINKTDRDGCLPIHRVVQRANLPLLHDAILFGAMDDPDVSGIRASEAAELLGHHEMVPLIRKYAWRGACLKCMGADFQRIEQECATECQGLIHHCQQPK